MTKESGALADGDAGDEVGGTLAAPATKPKPEACATDFRVARELGRGEFGQVTPPHVTDARRL